MPSFFSNNCLAVNMELYIVVPCYNEQEILEDSVGKLNHKIEELKSKHLIDTARILLVDDGSHDQTWTIIAHLADAMPIVCGIKLAHNVGHQRALWAGLAWASDRCDAAISIDADLQDDIEVFEEMAKHFRNGCDIVFGVRRERATDTWFKRNTALAFYKLMSALGSEIVYNHADYRLMSSRALKSLMCYPERNVFLRGIISNMGYPCAKVYYDRKERLAGESKYPLRKMISFALEGVTSFSIVPLRLISYLGLIFLMISFIVIISAIVTFIEGKNIPGWTSLQISLWFIGGFILIGCGITGEYIGKIYMETKQRPRYFIEKTAGVDYVNEENDAHSI